MANLSIPSVVLIVLGLIATIVSMAVNVWSTVKITATGYETYHGVVKICVSGSGQSLCYSFSDYPGAADQEIAYIRACLAGVCLAFIGGVVALVAGIVWVLNVGSEEIQKLLKPAIIVALVFAVFWNFIAVVVFGAMDKAETTKGAETTGIEYSYTLGYGWGMAILAMILHVIGIVTTMLTQKSE